jgi:pyrroloquinoline quinone (PQQ) biosynthesis protein C
MSMRSLIETEYARQAAAFAESELFQSLEKGTASRADYDDFVGNVCRSHLKSPQILAFLFALSPPAEAGNIKHNMLEELGLDEVGISHPELLRGLAEAAGFDEEGRARLEQRAQDELRRTISTPLLYGTLKEVGLSVLLETTCFEWMLSRLASRIARFLKDHRGLPTEALEWFTHHSEVDIRHAEEGLEAVVGYVEFYDFSEEDLQTILELTFRENPFIKRYFASDTLLEETAHAG